MRSFNLTQDRSYTLVAQTYALLGVGLFVAAVTAALSLHTVPSITSMILGFVGAIVLMFAAMFLKHSPVGFFCFLGFTSLMGGMTGPLIQHYLELPNGPAIVSTALSLTTAAVLGLSAFAFYSKRNFNSMGGFLFAGLIVVVVAGLLNLFLRSPLLDLVLAAVGALIFCGYILFDTSRILRGEIDSPIEGAISMFLNILNLFLDLLKLVAAFSSKDD